MALRIAKALVEKYESPGLTNALERLETIKDAHDVYGELTDPHHKEK